MIAFIGSVFSPYYHWSGRRDPDNHIAFNVALYSPAGNVWTMTERGRASLKRSREHLQIGPSSLHMDDGGLHIVFDETALPWPGQRLWTKRVRGRITLQPAFTTDRAYALDPDGRHQWWPRAPLSQARVECDLFPDGGFAGQGYHDINFGDRPLQKDFASWDWARGDGQDDGTLLLYDAVLRDGRRHNLALRYRDDGSVAQVAPPARQPLGRGFWGVSGGIGCDPGTKPSLVRRLEDTPFYTRSLVDTVIEGERVRLMQESLDCRRLDSPLVRLMLPFKMPRRVTGKPASG